MPVFNSSLPSLNRSLNELAMAHAPLFTLPRLAACCCCMSCQPVYMCETFCQQCMKTAFCFRGCSLLFPPGMNYEQPLQKSKTPALKPLDDDDVDRLTRRPATNSRRTSHLTISPKLFIAGSRLPLSFYPGHPETKSMGRGGRSAAAFAAGNNRLLQAKHILESSVLADRDTEVLRQHAKDRGLKTDGSRDELLIALHPFSKVRSRLFSLPCLLLCHVRPT